jgi:hypothetical protein
VVVTDTNAPSLTLTRMAPDTVVLSWPAPAGGWVLEHTDEIAGVPAAWSPVPQPYQTNTTTVSVSFPITPSPGNRCYRLRKP